MICSYGRTVVIGTQVHMLILNRGLQETGQ